MSTTLIKEILGVKMMLGDPMDQAPSMRQIANELELEYQQIGLDAANRNNAQHVGELVINTVADQRRYELGIDADYFYKALSISTIPAGATVTGDYANKRVTVTGGDDREFQPEWVEMEHLSDEWSWLAPNRGQLLSAPGESQVIAVYKTLAGGTGEKVVFEMRPTPSKVQSYLMMYFLTDWWDSIFLANSSAGVADETFKLPHSSQRALIRCRVALNLISKAVVKWSLNDDYNSKRGTVVANGLGVRLDRYKEAYEEYLDTLDGGGIVYIELYGDRL